MNPSPQGGHPDTRRVHDINGVDSLLRRKIERMSALLATLSARYGASHHLTEQVRRNLAIATAELSRHESGGAA